MEEFFENKSLDFSHYNNKCLSNPTKYKPIYEIWNVINKLEKYIQKTRDIAKEESLRGELEYEGVKYEVFVDSGAIFLTPKHVIYFSFYIFFMKIENNLGPHISNGIDWL